MFILAAFMAQEMEVSRKRQEYQEEQELPPADFCIQGEGTQCDGPLIGQI
jgi:hypothetical protein